VAARAGGGVCPKRGLGQGETKWGIRVEDYTACGSCDLPNMCVDGRLLVFLRWMAKPFDAMAVYTRVVRQVRVDVLWPGVVSHATHSRLARHARVHDYYYFVPVVHFHTHHLCCTGCATGVAFLAECACRIERPIPRKGAGAQRPMMVQYEEWVVSVRVTGAA
jgi:hypothetical protein